ncbi:hypothetical protein HZS_1939 [Henneguya salminicola]|nr:hypothetical protein HZS_1939 [Henneguya salminicola]
MCETNIDIYLIKLLQQGREIRDLNTSELSIIQQYDFLLKNDKLIDLDVNCKNKKSEFPMN